MPPVFTNPVFEELYKKDFFIDERVLLDIAMMGQEAIPELEKMVADGIDHFEEYEERDWNENFFFIHALYLLYELDAEQSLPLILKVTAQNSAFLEYWFSDSMFDDLPELIAKLGRNQVEACQAFVQNRLHSLQSRNIVTKALILIAIVYPEKREEISAFFKKQLRHFINNAEKIEELYPSDEDELGYSIYEYIGFLLLDLQENNFIELEEEIRECYRKDLIDEFVTGQEEDIRFEAKEVSLVKGIAEKYADFKKWFGESSPFHPDAEQIAIKRLAQEEKARKELEKWQKSQQAKSVPAHVVPVSSSAKVGRNDPCPCGSGKKYKKCCMDKDV